MEACHVGNQIYLKKRKKKLTSSEIQISHKHLKVEHGLNVNEAIRLTQLDGQQKKLFSRHSCQQECTWLSFLVV